MDSKKPKQKRKKVAKKRTRNRTLSVIGALVIGSTVPVGVSGAGAPVADRIARIRNAFAKTEPAPVTSAAENLREDVVTPVSKQDFSNFSNFNQAFDNFSNSFANF